MMSLMRGVLGVLLLFGIVGIILLLPTTAPSQVPPGLSCNALVQVANDFYLVDQTGASVARFTNDGLAKQSAALAPDGSEVAFILGASSNSFTVADRTGTIHMYTVPSSSDDGGGGSGSVLIGVAWAANGIVRLDKHIGKNTERFEFYAVTPTGLTETADPGLGSVCVLQPSEDDVACLQGNDVLVGPKIVYSDNGFTSAPQVGSLTLTVGASAPIKAVPGLQVQVTSIVAGVTLHVTLPTGNWIESRVNPGDSMIVPLEDQTLALLPTIIDPTQGIVTIVVRSNTGGPNAFDNALAWGLTDVDGLALIKNAAAGRSLVFLKPGKRPWSVLGQAAVDIREPVNAMRFVTPSLLYFETYAHFGIVPASVIHSASGPVLQVGTIATLPNNLTVQVTGSGVSTPVLTWACTAATTSRSSAVKTTRPRRRVVK
jgi:hypothetical protein